METDVNADINAGNAGFHLAQINVAQMKAPLDDPAMKRFVDWLAPINALAERSPGYVWRLQTAEGDATSLRVFDDEMMIVNMSAWESVEALKDYVYYSAHVELLKERRDWFDKMEKIHYALWWIPAGHVPTPEEGRERLELLQRLGPSPRAFIFSTTFAPAAEHVAS